MKRFLFLLLFIFVTGHASAQKSFSFFAIGDMPYHNPQDIERFKVLTQKINAEKSAFTIHVGDIKSGSSLCSDEYFAMMLQMFNDFRMPLIYTPGDNEWTDCHRPKAGSYDPIERLNAVRSTFFKGNKSLGKSPIVFRSQSQIQGFEEYVENVMWRKEKVTFGTVHVVGSNNNYRDDSDNNEFLKRDEANVRWLTEIFSAARQHNDAAIVLIMHGALNYGATEDNGFENIIAKLRAEVKSFAKPVLLVYGDHHRFEIKKPLLDEKEDLLPNFTSLMVFGDLDMHAVRIHVDPKSPGVFSFSEFIMDY